MGSDNNPSNPKTPLTDRQHPEELVTDSGLPDMKKPPKYKLAVLGTLIGEITCGVLGSIIYFTNKTKYDARISSLPQDSHYAFAAAAMFGFTVRFVNIYPMVHKAQIMSRKGSAAIGKNLRSNPFIYQMADAPGSPAKPNAVIFANEGAAGMYNRSNRSLQHMVENMGAMVVGLPMAGLVFPIPTFASTVLWSAGRLMHQLGYSSGYGGHGTGFGIATIAASAVEGLLMVVAAKGIMR